MNGDSLEMRIAAEIGARAEVLGLEADRVRVTYVLNWGGFVNRSYHVSDGTRRYHLKLADHPESLAGLRQWRAHHELLTARYHAPAMLDWIRVPQTALEGPLFEHLDGAPPESTAELIASISPVISRLHHDGDLGSRLAPDHPPRPCSDTFIGTYVRRFREDLAFVAAKRPEFVTQAVLEWMRAEVDAVEHEARTQPAFAQTADAPIHGDLWRDNLLMSPDGRWWVLDWDDLKLGDPALDWATLLGPSLDHPAPLGAGELPSIAGAGVRERLPLYMRATLLDWIIDPLADWVDADAAPEHTAAVRPEKERIHRAALARYRATY